LEGIQERLSGILELLIIPGSTSPVQAISGGQQLVGKRLFEPLGVPLALGIDLDLAHDVLNGILDGLLFSLGGR
jgi:hypothetical protein